MAHKNQTSQCYSATQKYKNGFAITRPVYCWVCEAKTMESNVHISTKDKENCFVLLFFFIIRSGVKKSFVFIFHLNLVKDEKAASLIMWTTALNRQLVTKKSHNESGRNRGAVTQPKTIWRKHQQSQFVWVWVCVCFDIYPAVQQDAFSAWSGKRFVSVFAVNYCNSSVSVVLKLKPHSTSDSRMHKHILHIGVYFL